MDDTDFIGKRFDRLTVVGVYDKKNKYEEMGVQMRLWEYNPCIQS